MSSSDEIARQLALQKNKARLSANPNTRLEQISEEMAHWKTRLSGADSDKALKKLLALRAEQSVLHIKNLRAESPTLADQKTNSILAAYYADCTRLLAATKRTNG